MCFPFQSFLILKGFTVYLSWNIPQKGLGTTCHLAISCMCKLLAVQSFLGFSLAGEGLASCQGFKDAMAKR